MKSSILILGTRMDPHVDRIMKLVESRTDLVARVLDFKAISDVSIRVSMDGIISFWVDENEIASNTLIWDRVKLLAGTEMYPAGDDRGSGYAAREWRSLYNLIAMFFGDQVINPLRSKRVMLKPYQQVQAAKAGFLVPPSLISNSKRDIVDFSSTAGAGTVLKSLSGGKIKPQGEGEYIPYNIMTLRVSTEDLANSSADEFSVCPHFLQHEIKKAFELRIVVVADYIRAFSINSQDYDCSSLDWRNGIPILKFLPFELSEEVSKNILKFMQSMGFIFGSIDIIVDTNGDYWFLECNEDGQWAWLDDVVDGAISERFADELIVRASALTAGQRECV